MTIDHTKVPSTQSNFTVLVSVTDPALKTVANGGHVANANGYDVGFYADSGGTMKLKWEVEQYNGTTGHLIAWVKIPSVSNSSDTVFYLMYGNSAINTDQSDPPNTWDSSFKGVYHLRDGITLSGADSTSLANTLAVNSASAISGLIDGASTAGTNQSLGRGSITHNSAIATVSAWIKATTATGRIAGLDQDGTTHSQEIAIDANNKAVAYAWDTINGQQRICTGTTNITTGVWHYMVGTWDGTTGRVYLDGSLEGSIASANVYAAYTSPNMEIGGHATSGPASVNAYFSGNIDEVRFSYVARSATWITTEYNNQSSPGTFTTMGSESCPTPTPTPTATPAPGLVAAYGFNEGSGTVVNDASGNGNNGTINGATWTTSGKYRNALNFNGTNALVTINNAASLQLTTGMTLEAWVYPTVSGPWWADVIYKGNDNYYLEGTSNPSGFSAMGGTIPNAPPLYGTGVLALNTWAHLAATYDGATMRLYVNGVQVASRAQTGAIVTSTSPLQIGGDSIYGQYFAGRIDEVRIYNRALSVAQIQSDMNTPL